MKTPWNRDNFKSGGMVVTVTLGGSPLPHPYPTDYFVSTLFSETAASSANCFIAGFESFSLLLLPDPTLQLRMSHILNAIVMLL